MTDWQREMLRRKDAKREPTLEQLLEMVPEDYSWRLRYSRFQKKYRFNAEHGYKVHLIGSGKTPAEALQAALEKINKEGK